MTATGEGMRFEPLYYGDRIHVVNPCGDVGILTLWTPRRTALRLLERLDPALVDPERGRVAAVANLYGDGMHHMLANLAFNPQIRHLIAVGNDRGLPTCAEIEAFLAHGLEPATLLGTRVWRIPGTERVSPVMPGFDADDVRARLSFAAFGGFDDAGRSRDLPAYVASLPAPPADPGRRVRVVLEDAVGTADGGYRPSEVGAHQVVRETPLDCWTELVTRAVRFGRPVDLGGGQRLELINTVAVIRNPVEEPAEVLSGFGFSRDAFDAYQQSILDPTPPDDGTYTYGNRMRGHFRRDGVPVDSLLEAAAALRRSPNTRQAYVTLWDPTLDQSPDDTAPDADGERPCLVSLAFRRSGDTLALTATYRAHNLLTAWLQNVYGLIAIQRFVASRAGMGPGPLTVISHSLGADPASPRFAAARALAAGWHGDEDVVRSPGEPDRRRLREDPNGHFVVTADHEAGEIVAQHLFGGLMLKEYRGRKAATIERQLLADMAVSLVSHALWLGRELRDKQADLEARPGRREGGGEA